MDEAELSACIIESSPCVTQTELINLHATEIKRIHRHQRTSLRLLLLSLLLNKKARSQTDTALQCSVSARMSCDASKNYISR